MTSAFIEIARVGDYRILRHSRKWLYVAWYDAGARQIRRRSLGTKDVAKAVAMVTALVDRGINGDPIDALKSKPIHSVRELLEWHRPYVRSLASAEAEEIHIDHINNSLLADRRLASLTQIDFEGLRDAWVADGISIATVSRRLSTLRSGVSRAVNNRLLARDHAPAIPEFRTKNHIRAAAPKGSICATRQFASLYDAVSEPHLNVLLALLFALAARDGAMFDLKGEQVDRENNLINLNPNGRMQTKKYRPVLPIVAPLQAWTAFFPAGHVIQWRGARLRSAKSGIRRAVINAGLPRTVNPYSVRHSLGRYMRLNRVETEEIAIWMGHMAPPDNPETTLVYSPYDPSYLQNAKAATEAFFREIASHARTPLLEPPPSVAAYFKRLRWQEENGSRGCDAK